MESSALPQPFRRHWFPSYSKSGTVHFHVITTAASVRLCHHLRRHLHLSLNLRSSLERFFQPFEIPRIKVFHWETPHPLLGVDLFRLAVGALFASHSSSTFFFDGQEATTSSRTEEGSHSDSSRRNSFSRRRWTNFLLAINVTFYIAQIATQGKLLFWGAKINSLIEKGQLWRLATSSILHANVAHLMINCYSLNSVGPTVENISGPKRFLAVYLTSAIASSAMSYWFSKAPAVGASGAIFGLVGSVAVFVLRHKGLVKGGNEDLQQIFRVIILNLAMGLLSKGIDNWGHIGGLLGGAATSWLLGPSWKHEATSIGGRKVFVDRAPIFHLVNLKHNYRKPK